MLARDPHLFLLPVIALLQSCAGVSLPSSPGIPDGSSDSVLLEYQFREGETYTWSARGVWETREYQKTYSPRVDTTRGRYSGTFTIVESHSPRASTLRLSFVEEALELTTRISPGGRFWEETWAQRFGEGESPLLLDVVHTPSGRILSAMPPTRFRPHEGYTDAVRDLFGWSLIPSAFYALPEKPLAPGATFVVRTGEPGPCVTTGTLSAVSADSFRALVELSEDCERTDGATLASESEMEGWFLFDLARGVILDAYEHREVYEEYGSDGRGRSSHSCDYLWHLSHD